MFDLSLTCLLGTITKIFFPCGGVGMFFGRGKDNIWGRFKKFGETRILWIYGSMATATSLGGMGYAVLGGKSRFVCLSFSLSHTHTRLKIVDVKTPHQHNSNLRISVIATHRCMHAA